MSLTTRVRPNGAAIKNFREAREMTIQQCASTAGIAMSAVYYYETEQRRCSIASLLKVAKALRVPPQAICRDDLTGIESEIEQVAS